MRALGPLFMLEGAQKEAWRSPVDDLKSRAALRRVKHLANPDEPRNLTVRVQPRRRQSKRSAQRPWLDMLAI